MKILNYIWMLQVEFEIMNWSNQNWFVQWLKVDEISKSQVLMKFAGNGNNGESGI